MITFSYRQMHLIPTVAQQVFLSSWCPLLVCLSKCSHQIFNNFRGSTKQHAHTRQLCRKWNRLNGFFKSILPHINIKMCICLSTLVICMKETEATPNPNNCKNMQQSSESCIIHTRFFSKFCIIHTQMSLKSWKK